MAARAWQDDDDLLANLRDALLSSGPITDELVSPAKRAYAWRTVDEDLALLSLDYDSLVDEGVLVRSSGGGEPRTVVFASLDLSVEIELSRSGLLGQVVPPAPAQVEVETSSGASTPVQADEVGVFSMPDGPTQPFRLRLTLDSGAAAVTDWINPA